MFTIPEQYRVSPGNSDHIYIQLNTIAVIKARSGGIGRKVDVVAKARNGAEPEWGDGGHRESWGGGAGGGTGSHRESQKTGGGGGGTGGRLDSQKTRQGEAVAVGVLAAIVKAIRRGEAVAAVVKARRRGEVKEVLAAILNARRRGEVVAEGVMAAVLKAIRPPHTHAWGHYGPGGVWLSF